MDKLIEKHLEGWYGLEKASIDSFAETGKVSGSLFSALKNMLDEHLQTHQVKEAALQHTDRFLTAMVDVEQSNIASRALHKVVKNALSNTTQQESPKCPQCKVKLKYDCDKMRCPKCNDSEQLKQVEEEQKKCCTYSCNEKSYGGSIYCQAHHQMHLKYIMENGYLKEGQTSEQVEERVCLHEVCPQCNGSGKQKNGSDCIHFISCPCPKCSFT